MGDQVCGSMRPPKMEDLPKNPQSGETVSPARRSTRAKMQASPLPRYNITDTTLTKERLDAAVKGTQVGKNQSDYSLRVSIRHNKGKHSTRSPCPIKLPCNLTPENLSAKRAVFLEGSSDTVSICSEASSMFMRGVNVIIKPSVVRICRLKKDDVYVKLLPDAGVKLITETSEAKDCKDQKKKKKQKLTVDSTSISKPVVSQKTPQMYNQMVSSNTVASSRRASRGELLRPVPEITKVDKLKKQLGRTLNTARKSQGHRLMMRNKISDTNHGQLANLMIKITREDDPSFSVSSGVSRRSTAGSTEGMLRRMRSGKPRLGRLSNASVKVTTSMVTTNTSESTASANTGISSGVPKKRGRPRKYPKVLQDTDTDHSKKGASENTTWFRQANKSPEPPAGATFLKSVTVTAPPKKERLPSTNSSNTDQPELTVVPLEEKMEAISASSPKPTERYSNLTTEVEKKTDLLKPKNQDGAPGADAQNKCNQDIDKNISAPKALSRRSSRSRSKDNQEAASSLTSDDLLHEQMDTAKPSPKVVGTSTERMTGINPLSLPAGKSTTGNNALPSDMIEPMELAQYDDRDQLNNDDVNKTDLKPTNLRSSQASQYKGNSDVIDITYDVCAPSTESTSSDEKNLQKDAPDTETSCERLEPKSPSCTENQYLALIPVTSMSDADVTSDKDTQLSTTDSPHSNPHKETEQSSINPELAGNMQDKPVDRLSVEIVPTLRKEKSTSASDATAETIILSPEVQKPRTEEEERAEVLQATELSNKSNTDSTCAGILVNHGLVSLATSREQHGESHSAIVVCSKEPVQDITEGLGQESDDSILEVAPPSPTRTGEDCINPATSLLDDSIIEVGEPWSLATSQEFMQSDGHLMNSSEDGNIAEENKSSKSQIAQSAPSAVNLENYSATNTTSDPDMQHDGAPPETTYPITSPPPAGDISLVTHSSEVVPAWLSVSSEKNCASSMPNDELSSHAIPPSDTPVDLAGTFSTDSNTFMDTAMNRQPGQFYRVQIVEPKDASTNNIQLTTSRNAANMDSVPATDVNPVNLAVPVMTQSVHEKLCESENEVTSTTDDLAISVAPVNAAESDQDEPENNEHNNRNTEDQTSTADSPPQSPSKTPSKAVSLKRKLGQAISKSKRIRESTISNNDSGPSGQMDVESDIMDYTSQQPTTEYFEGQLSMYPTTLNYKQWLSLYEDANRTHPDQFPPGRCYPPAERLITGNRDKAITARERSEILHDAQILYPYEFCAPEQIIRFFEAGTWKPCLLEMHRLLHKYSFREDIHAELQREAARLYPDEFKSPDVAVEMHSSARQLSEQLAVATAEDSENSTVPTLEYYKDQLSLGTKLSCVDWYSMYEEANRLYPFQFPPGLPYPKYKHIHTSLARKSLVGAARRNTIADARQMYPYEFCPPKQVLRLIESGTRQPTLMEMKRILSRDMTKKEYVALHQLASRLYPSGFKLATQDSIPAKKSTSGAKDSASVQPMGNAGVDAPKTLLERIQSNFNLKPTIVAPPKESPACVDSLPANHDPEFSYEDVGNKMKQVNPNSKASVMKSPPTAMNSDHDTIQSPVSKAAVMHARKSISSGTPHYPQLVAAIRASKHATSRPMESALNKISSGAMRARKTVSSPIPHQLDVPSRVLSARKTMPRSPETTEKKSLRARKTMLREVASAQNLPNQDPTEGLSTTKRTKDKSIDEKSTLYARKTVSTTSNGSKSSQGALLRSPKFSQALQARALTRRAKKTLIQAQRIKSPLQGSTPTTPDPPTAATTPEPVNLTMKSKPGTNMARKTMSPFKPGLIALHDSDSANSDVEMRVLSDRRYSPLTVDTVWGSSAQQKAGQGFTTSNNTTQPISKRKQALVPMDLHTDDDEMGSVLSLPSSQVSSLKEQDDQSNRDQDSDSIAVSPTLPGKRWSEMFCDGMDSNAPSSEERSKQKIMMKSVYTGSSKYHQPVNPAVTDSQTSMMTPDGLSYPLIPGAQQDMPPIPETSLQCSCRPAVVQRPSVKITFCQAVDTVGDTVACCGGRVCDSVISRASVRTPYLALCKSHKRRFAGHKSCPICGQFCTAGEFWECKPGSGHLYHKSCQITSKENQPVCPHCGKVSAQIVVTLQQPHVQKKKEETTSKSIPRSSPEDRSPGTVAKMCIRLVAQPSTTDASSDEHTSFTDRLYTVKDNSLLNKNKLISVLSGLKHLEPLMKEKIQQHNPMPVESLVPFIKKSDIAQLVLALCDFVKTDYCKHSYPSATTLNEQVKGEQGQTLLHIAVKSNSLAAVHSLIVANVQVDQPNLEGKTAMMLAAQLDYIDIVKYLVSAGAKVESRDFDGMFPLHLAAKAGHVDVCDYLLLNCMANVDAVDDGGWTALVWAIEHSHLEVVKLLIRCGANVHTRDNENNASIHWAAYSGNMSIMQLLFDHRADTESVNEHGDRPLHIAVRQGRTEAIVMLVSRGADTSALNNEHETPVDCCTWDEATKTFLSVNQTLRSCRIEGVQSRPSPLILQDLSRGREKIPIPVFNDVDGEGLPVDFHYITEHVWTSPVPINTMISSLTHCTCASACGRSACVCSRSSITCWYTKDGLLCDEFDYMNPPNLFECNKRCTCWMNCSNRLIQHGVTCQLELFKTRHRGWGVKTRLDIPKGTFVCEYIGELLTDSEADTREDDSYLFDLDNKDGETYCIDARYYGNISRFINHRCEPNLTPVRVFVDHQDLRFPKICFFAKEDIPAGQELGFDYGEKFWIVKYKEFLCDCSSRVCKYNHANISKILTMHNISYPTTEQLNESPNHKDLHPMLQNESNVGAPE